MSPLADRNLRRLYSSLFLWMVGVGLYDQLIPIFARQLGASAVQLGTLFTLRHIGLAAGFMVGWAAADRFNRRTVMLASWMLGAPVPLLLAAAPGYLWLLPGLLLYELTYFGQPAIHAYVTERVPPSELASAFGMMGTITSMGFLVSPAMGGFVADRWGIRATLLVGFVMFLASTALILRLQHTGAGAVPQQGARALSWDQIRPLAPALATYAALHLVVLIPVPFMTPFLREARGVSLSAIGFLGSMVALGAVLLTPVAGRLGDRLGVGPTTAGQLTVFAAGVLLTVFGPAALLPVAAMLRCRSPLHTLAHAMVGAAAEPPILGRAFAIAGMLSALAAAAGSFVGGFAYRADPSYPLLMSVGVGVAMAAVLLWRRPIAGPARGSAEAGSVAATRARSGAEAQARAAAEDPR
jgi:MFS family permease